MLAKRHIPTDHPPFAALPVRMVTLGDGRLQAAVKVSGTLSSRRVPVVCIPGYQRNMTDFTDFDAYFQRIGGGNWPVVLIDLPGRGRSADRVRAEDYGSLRDAEDIAGVLAALGIESAVFLGQGYGGQVTMALAATSAALSSAMLKRSGCTPAGNCAASSRPNASSILITALRNPGQANSFALAAP